MKMREIEKTPAAAMPRAAYVVQGSSTFVGVFGSGSAARCRIVTVLDNYVAVEVLTVPETKARFEQDAELGFVREVPPHVFGNHEAKALWRLQQLTQTRYMHKVATVPLAPEFEHEGRVIGFYPPWFGSAA